MSVLALSLLVLAASAEWLGDEPAQVERIVSLAPSHTELVFALGAGSRVVGVTRFDDWPPGVASLPRVGGFVDPSVEAVLALRPDLVLAAPVPGARQRLEVLAGLGAPVLVLPAESLADLWRAIDVIGRALAVPEAATALSARLRRELEAVRATARGTPPVRVLFVVGYRPLVAAGPGSFLSEVAALANGVNVVTRGAPFAQLDLEAVVAARPQVVLDLTMGEATPAGFWARLEPLLGASTPRVVQLDDPALLRPGPRLAGALGRLAAALRPAP